TAVMLGRDERQVWPATEWDRAGSGPAGPRFDDSPHALDRVSRRLRAGHVGTVLLVLRADVLENVAVGEQRQRGLEAKRPGVILRVVERPLHVHVADVTPTIAFGDAHGFASRVSKAVQPRPVVETGRFDYQRIALPVSD